MKNDPRFSQEVKIAKDKSAKWDCKNPYAVDNVNQAQGPRTGVQGLAGKRSDFIEDKKAKAPLARVITDAYARRAHEYKEFEYTNGGSIHDNTNERVARHKGKISRSK